MAQHGQIRCRYRTGIGPILFRELTEHCFAAPSPYRVAYSTDQRPTVPICRCESIAMASPTALGQWMTVLLGPNLLAIVVGSVLALGLPVLVHYFLYRPRAEQGLPTFLVAGPSGSGKTTLATYVSVILSVWNRGRSNSVAA